MIWDFRNLIRRGGGPGARDWRNPPRPVIRLPAPGPKAAPPPPPEADERWLTPPWHPPEDSADAWRQSE